MRWHLSRCALALLGMPLVIGLSATAGAKTTHSASTKSITYGGLRFTIPKSWPFYTAATVVLEDQCGFRAPAVVIGRMQYGGVATSTCSQPIPEVNTVLEIESAGGGQGTYASAAASRNGSPSTGYTNRTQTFTRNGVHVLIKASRPLALPDPSPGLSNPNAWGMQAYFDGYPVVIVAGSSGDGSLAQAKAIVESVHPMSPLG
jgi:hypothetical protein